MKNNSAELTKKILALEKKIALQKKHNKILYYNIGDKIHNKQLQFHKNPCRNRWVFGGNRSGKTECGAVECVYMARGIHPYRKNKDSVFGWVVSVSTAVQRDVAQNKILSYINPTWIHEIVMSSGKSASPNSGIIDFIVLKNVFGGFSKIGFKSCEMGREKFQGASLDFVWFDEEPPKDIYDECRMRLLDKCGDIFGTMTPLLGLTFMYEHIFLNISNDPNIWHICMEWDDNPYLDKAEIKALSATLSNDELQSRKYGKFKNEGGLVYSEFDEKVHVIEPFNVPMEWYNNISIDPGLNNPLSCHFYAVNGDGDVYVVAEHYEAGKDIAYHVSAIKAHCRALNWHTDNKGRYCALIDSAAGQRTLASLKSVSELFFEHDFLVNTKVNKDLFSGIARVKNYLKDVNKKPRIFIFKTCVNMIREFKSYWWGKGDTPKKTDDHALDELRYFLMSRPEPAVAFMPKKSDAQLHKEKLIRRARRIKN